MLERRMDSYTIETTHWGDDWVAKRTRRLSFEKHERAQGIPRFLVNACYGLFTS
ncbi:hypothetical protein ISN44_As05g030970 [Arabidopsis suecica]|uniref:Uncharacterized protein n=1 Tax=Arabidopsis suecica TaxID=45249 RepID=A0A8T2DFE0_ARASU|nr:hypothetical protein ISN44_As05g030970 [Arabidopsis suecica]